MTKKDQKFLFYILVSVILTLGLTMSLQPLLADWVAPNTNPPNVVNSLGTPIMNESGTIAWYELGKETWITEDFFVSKGGTTYFHVDTSNPDIPYTGIGTDAPVAELHVVSDRADYTAVRIENTASDDSIWELRALNDPEDFAIWGGAEHEPMNNKLRIDGKNGNISIGHDEEAVAKLDIYGGIHLRENGNDYAQINVVGEDPDYSEIRYGGVANNNFRIIWDDDPNTVSGVEIFTIHYVDGTNYGLIGINEPDPETTLEVNGDISYSLSIYQSTSDERLKDINKNYNYGLDEIIKLQPVYFNFKKNNPLNINSTKEHIGLIAQEVEEVIPEAVRVRSDGYKALNDYPVFWAMLNSIKELREILCDLNSANELCVSQ